MRKINLILIPSIFLLASCGVTTGNTTTAETEAISSVTTTEEIKNLSTTEDESGLSYRKLTDAVNSYYQEVDTSKRGTDFIDELTPVISKNYVRYSYKGAWDILAKADADPYNASNIVCMYTGKSIPANLDSNSKGWNREHTWAKSHGFNQEGLDAYTDCHHLTATDSSINNARGDLDFGEVEDYEGTVTEDSYGNKWITGTIFEPRDEVKGDVARMLFYMMARYNDSTLNLELVDGTTSASDAGYGTLGDLSTLLKWNYMDPVSDTEIERNEVVYSYQKNRNPFIDHPEWVNLMFPDTEYVDEEVNENDVKAITDVIGSLPSLITLDNEDEVNSIRNLINSLNDQEKLYVNNYYVLTSAEYQISYLKNKESLDEGDVNLDFSTLAANDSGGYKKEASLTASGFAFTVSSYYTGSGEFRLGTNGKSVTAVSLSDFGLTSTGSYLKASFTTENIQKVKVNLSSTKSNVSAVHVYVVSGEEVHELTSVTDASAVTATTDEALTGIMVLVIEGATARLGISSISIYTE